MEYGMKAINRGFVKRKQLRAKYGSASWKHERGGEGKNRREIRKKEDAEIRCKCGRGEKPNGDSHLLQG